jgi:hypothetical protein
MKLTIRMLFLCMLFPCFLFAREGFLAGSESGLYSLERGRPELIWGKTAVRKIVKAGDSWFLLTDSGIWTSKDLVSFEERNAGLPVKTIKVPQNNTKTFVREVQELKDLEIHPTNPLIMITATKDSVFLTRDGGYSWKDMGMCAQTVGLKSVTVLDLPDAAGVPKLTIIMSHPIYGLSWKQPDARNEWADLDAGLDIVPSIKWPDEIADLAAVSRNGTTELFASQTFMPRIYRLDWASKKFIKVWSGTNFIDTVEGLNLTNRSILFTAPDHLKEIPFVSGNPVVPAPAASESSVAEWDTALSMVPGEALCAWIPENLSGNRGNLSLSELWLLRSSSRSGKYAIEANQKKGIYIPVNQVTTDAGYNAHLKTIRDNNLNMLVVDMKDDYGTLRYDAKDPLVVQKGKTGKGILVEPFVKKAKENGTYLVARIVVFKDRSLAAWGDSRYAIWDKTENQRWKGYEWVTQQIPTVSETTSEAATAAAAGTLAPTTEKTRKYYDESWVDPYSEEVWEYNIAIAKELIARGFDEIQFDYIRFPTDGANLDNASYRWKDAGMDKESALMSFLSYARSQINAPISIDIYGANGWYRTGARTGQDVELLSRYVDVICPMFYPSHFEQIFLAQNPASERPYRIFYYGSYRNTIIARNRVIVRPWAQAFYLGVSYDKAWYNPDYVQRQIFGARDSINEGYTYWNNSGRYGDLRPDVDISTPYPWSTPEAISGNPRPVFGSQ